jgi:hypothetical protein
MFPAAISPRVIVLAGLIVVSVAGCGTSGPQTTATTTASTAPTTTTTTTTIIPTAPATTPDQAASSLVADWASANKVGALTVGTAQAVDTLFAVPYRSGLAIDRGCSTAFPPIVCTYGPPGGAPPSDPIYQIYVSQTAKGWYVSSVRIDQ